MGFMFQPNNIFPSHRAFPASACAVCSSRMLAFSPWDMRGLNQVLLLVPVTTVKLGVLSCLL